MIVNKTRILVTGATGGIGAALCRQLSAAGALLVMTCQDRDKLKQLQQELGEEHMVVSADVGTEEGRRKIADSCEQFAVTGVINLAGIMNFGMFADQPNATVEKMLQINTVAPILLTRTLLPQLMLQPRARIVNVGSIFGSIGHPGFAVYCASKAAIRTFSEALSRELADTGVSVAYIAPRATRTALNPDRVVAMNKALGNKSDTPELVASTIIGLFESSDNQCFMGWPEKFFVKLNALLPGLVRQSLVKNLSLIRQYAQQ